MLSNDQIKIYKKLGIPLDYGEKNIIGNRQKLTKKAALHWFNLIEVAENDQISLMIVSGFRSFDYQVNLILRKLERGIAIEDILEVNAPPGYSQHHAGIAVDVATRGQAPLIDEFENTAAFEWLKNNANRYNFHMPYERNNIYGFIYEPWHWVFT
jgi:D-alanyl-D-alanine carboxypeptidase